MTRGLLGPVASERPQTHLETVLPTVHLGPPVQCANGRYSSIK